MRTNRRKLIISSAYEQLKYIENNSTAYIQTRFVPNINSSFLYTFAYTQFTNDDCFGVGSYDSGWGLHTHSENNIGYTDNPKFVKEVDFYNTSLQQIDDINSKVQTGKNKSMKLIKTNPNSDGSYSDDNTLEEYPDHSIEWYRPLSKTGYLNIFLNILLFLSIGIILGSILFVNAIS